MLFRVVPELLPVTEGEHLAAVESLPVLCGHDDSGNVIRVAIYRHAPLEDVERDAFFLQVAIVDADQRRELGAGGMSADKDSLWIAAILGDVSVHPAKWASFNKLDIINNNIGICHSYFMKKSNIRQIIRLMSCQFHLF